MGGVFTVMVMLADNDAPLIHYLAGRYPDRIGWLFGPSILRKRARKLQPWIGYAVDNDRFTVWKQGVEWDEAWYWKTLEWFSEQEQQPRWVLCPDVIQDKDATLKDWHKYADRLHGMGFDVAIAVQPGFCTEDVPPGADVIFVGGGTVWRWKTLREWTARFPRVHLGMANSERLLWMAHDAGCESCDGTGWFRNEGTMMPQLLRYLDESTHGRKQLMMDDILGQGTTGDGSRDAEYMECLRRAGGVL